MIKLVLNASRGAQWTSRDNELYCHKCGEVSVGKGAYDDETKLANSYCTDCLAEVMQDALTNKPHQMPWRKVPRAQHDVVLAEAIGGDATHPKWCICGWCKPLIQEAQDD